MIETTAPVPPASGLSDERLAEIKAWYDVLVNAGLGAPAHIGELLAEIARTRSDAALGAALREALASLRNDEHLRIPKSCDDRDFLAWVEDCPVKHTSAVDALAALLSRVPEERTRT